VATNAMVHSAARSDATAPGLRFLDVAAQAKTYGLSIPEIHVVVGKSIDAVRGASAAFKRVRRHRRTRSSRVIKLTRYFTARKKPAPDIHTFAIATLWASETSNTAGIVAAHLGRPLSTMDGGTMTCTANQCAV